MSKNYQIDLIEFPATSVEEVARQVAFFTTVFGWTFKDWGGSYADTPDSGTMTGINGTEAQQRQTMPLAVIYADDLEATKESVVQAGGVIVHQ